jgi:MoxR-like ATPase
VSETAIPSYQPGQRSTADDTPEWMRAIRDPSDHPRHYVAEDGLRHAVEIAVYLRQPLLLTGEPGTGKTQLGYSVAWEFNMAPPLRFNTKSVTTARDLFYTFDTLARFRDAQLTRSGDVNVFDSRKYLALRPLGEAIVRARARDQNLAWLSPEWTHLSRDARRRSVVIVDEIDKAARDVPNDVLDEVEQFRFQIPELDNIAVTADPALSPILIFTSNSEKNLPDAFLRRCVYHNINFPDKETLDSIIASRLSSAAATKPPLVRDAVELFTKLRDPGTGIRKAPGTAELLNWIRVLRALDLPEEDALVTHSDEVHKSIGVLIKSRDDLPLAVNVITVWAFEAKKLAEIASAGTKRS